jgi:hypothetical protein
LIKLFLHIGTHKTGSTSLQNRLHTSREALLKHGILYPETGLSGTAHHELAWKAGLGARDWDPDYLSRSFRAIATEAEQLGVDTVVLSSEEFSSVRKVKAFQELSELFDVRVVAYLRKQDRYLESTYNQHVRMYDKRFSGSVYQFALAFNFYDRFNYRRLFKHWESFFGEDKIIVRPYGTELVERDTCIDFVRLINDAAIADISANPKKGDSDNISLPASAMPYLALFNRQQLTFEQHVKVTELLAKKIEPIKGGRLLRYDDAEQFYSRFRRSNRYISEHYLGLDHDVFSQHAEPITESTYIPHSGIDDELWARLVSRLGYKLNSRKPDSI